MGNAGGSRHGLIGKDDSLLLIIDMQESSTQFVEALIQLGYGKGE